MAGDNGDEDDGLHASCVEEITQSEKQIIGFGQTALDAFRMIAVRGDAQAIAAVSARLEGSDESIRRTAVLSLWGDCCEGRCTGHRCCEGTPRSQ